MSAQNADHVVETPTASTWLGQDGVLRHRIKNGITLDLAHARANLEVVKELCKGVPRPMVADMSGLLSAPRPVREFYAGSEAAESVRCVALVSKSPVSFAIGNFWLRISPPPYPTRLFRSRAEALKWARSLA